MAPPAAPTDSPEAFARLVAQHQRAVCAVAYATLRDVGRSEEIAQEAFLLAWQKLPGLSEPPKLPAWICGIARNLARNAKRAVRDQATDSEAALAALGGSPEPLDQLLEAERGALVDAALGQLDARYREPLVLFYRHDRSLREVAEALQLSEANAKQRVSRGRALLADRLAGLVEASLSRSGPGAAFTAAVAAAIAAAPRPAQAAATRVSAPAAAKPALALKLAAAALVLGGAAALWRLAPQRSDPASPSAGATASAAAAAGGSRDRAARIAAHPVPGPRFRPRAAAADAVRSAAPPAGGGAAPVRAELARALEREVDLELREVKTKDVLKLLSEVAQVPVVVRGEIGSEVSLELHAVTIQEALDETLDAADAVWREVDLVSVVAGPGPRGPSLDGAPIDLVLREVPFADAVAGFEEILGRPVQLAPGVGGDPVTLNVQRQPAGDVFVGIVDRAGARWELVPAIEVRADDAP